MKATEAVRRHWPKLLASLLAAMLVAVVAREIPPAIRYIKMETM